jgi:hypothetical protein
MLLFAQEPGRFHSCLAPLTGCRDRLAVDMIDHITRCEHPWNRGARPVIGKNVSILVKFQLTL